MIVPRHIKPAPSRIWRHFSPRPLDDAADRSLCSSPRAALLFFFLLRFLLPTTTSSPTRSFIMAEPVPGYEHVYQLRPNKQTKCLFTIIRDRKAPR